MMRASSIQCVLLAREEHGLAGKVLSGQFRPCLIEDGQGVVVVPLGHGQEVESELLLQPRLAHEAGDEVAL